MKLSTTLGYPCEIRLLVDEIWPIPDTRLLSVTVGTVSDDVLEAPDAENQ